MGKFGRVARKDEDKFIRELARNKKFLESIHKAKNGEEKHTFGEVIQTLRKNPSALGLEETSAERGAVPEEVSIDQLRAGEMETQTRRLSRDLWPLREGLSETVTRLEGSHLALEKEYEKLDSKVEDAYEFVRSFCKTEENNN